MSNQPAVLQNPLVGEPSGSCWFAAWTRSRQEKVAAAMLQASGVQIFLPLKSELRQWSDRVQTVEVPLFSGYLFIRMNAQKESRFRVLNIPGIAGLVGNGSGPWPIPDQQIEAIRTILVRRVECSLIPLLEEGSLVRVIRGPLTGIEGRLLQSKSTSRLLISIGMVRQSVAVQLSREDVELIDRSVASTSPGVSVTRHSRIPSSRAMLTDRRTSFPCD
jgi:transcription antitermination factor NusG